LIKPLSETVRLYFKSLELQKRVLSEYGIPKEGIEKVIEKLEMRGEIKMGEQKALTAERLKTLLNMRF